MYSIYNSDTLDKLINTVHKMHNIITWNERLFVVSMVFVQGWKWPLYHKFSFVHNHDERKVC